MNGSKKVSETFLCEKLGAVFAEAERRFDVRLHLVEIIGTRWSYLWGRRVDEKHVSVPHRIILTGRLGLIVYGPGRDAFDVSCVREKILEALSAV